MKAILPLGLARGDRDYDGMSDTARPTIAKLTIGQQGWALPGALYHDEDRRLWLAGWSKLFTQPTEFATMHVRRDGAGWHVDASRCGQDVTWCETEPQMLWDPIPVATFTDNRSSDEDSSEQQVPLQLFYVKHTVSQGPDYSRFVIAATPQDAFKVWREDYSLITPADLWERLWNSDCATVLTPPPAGAGPRAVEDCPSVTFNIKTGEIVTA